jgi:hypothetical protein
MVADYNGTNLALAVDEQTDLPVDFAGDKRYLPGKVIVDNIFRRDAPAAKVLYLFDLRGTQSGCISKNFIDSRFAFLICQYASITGQFAG